MIEAKTGFHNSCLDPQRSSDENRTCDMATTTTGGSRDSPLPPQPLPKDQQKELDSRGAISGSSAPSGGPSTGSDGGEQKAEAPKGRTSMWKSFLSGGFGGVCSVIVGQPFDLTKTRLQTAPTGKYAGTMDVVRQTFAKDGITGFYRGMSSPLAGVTPMFAVSFWGYAMGKKVVYAASPNRTDPTLSYAEFAFAGAFSSLPTTLVAAPMERIKVLLQVDGQGDQPKYKGPVDCIRQVYKEGGLKSIFRGSTATVARDAPGSAAYFVAYEAAKHALTPAGSDPSDLNLGAICAAGGFAGVAMWSIAIPPDVLKSRIQTAPSGTYSGFLDCAKKTIAQDGVKALFKGFGPAMLRAVPANAATFLGVEVMTATLNKVA